MTIGTFTRPVTIRFGMTGATGVIQCMVITGTPTAGTMMTGFTTARIMAYWC